jgi:hypothetical protein
MEIASLLETCNELYELAAGPMKSQNKTPTSLATLVDFQATVDTSKNQISEQLSNVSSLTDSNENETTIVTKIFVDILDKCMFFLIIYLLKIIMFTYFL